MNYINPPTISVLDAIRARRSIKHFDSTHTMDRNEERNLIELGMLSPTSFNIQNWRFVIVRDTELRKKIRAVSWNQPQITDASLLVILAADLKAWQKNPERYWRHLDQKIQHTIVPLIHSSYGENETKQRDEAHRSIGIAAQTLMLAARGLGYDSCPMGGFDHDAVAELINLPKDHIVSLMLAIGRATTAARPRTGPVDYNDVVFENRFP